jgi:hypothetical protein
MTEQITSPKTAVRENGPRDLLSRLYREIGISAVAAALESSARKPQKAAQAPRQEAPAVLRDDEAA